MSAVRSSCGLQSRTRGLRTASCARALRRLRCGRRFVACRLFVVRFFGSAYLRSSPLPLPVTHKNARNSGAQNTWGRERSAGGILISYSYKLGDNGYKSNHIYRNPTLVLYINKPKAVDRTVHVRAGYGFSQGTETVGVASRSATRRDRRDGY